jgi:hypothetical protein
MDLSRYNGNVNAPGKLASALGNISNRQTTTSQMVLQHGMNMEAAHHGNELAKDYATHAGNIQSGLSAQEHSQTSALSAQEHGQRLKEDAASRRHEIKKIVLTHNNDLQKAAVEHHLSTDKLRTESGLRVTEANNTSTNTINEANVAHKHAGDLLNRIAASGQGGTDVSFKHKDINAKFTLKTPPSPATSPTPTAAPRQTKSFVGMPGNRAGAPRSAFAAAAAAGARAQTPEAPKGPQPTVKRGANGRMVSLKEATTPVASAPAKKAPAKKAAPAKGQPTVTRDPKTGRMVGIKKK